MAKTIRVNFRSFLPGAGFTRGGKPKQGKTNIRGRVAVSSYTHGGESLTASDLGLDTIDDLVLTVEDAVVDADPATSFRLAGYNRTGQEFYVTQGLNVGTELVDGTAVNISFDAFGDSAHDIELT